jgi:hypothetical protein
LSYFFCSFLCWQVYRRGHTFFVEPVTRQKLLWLALFAATLLLGVNKEAVYRLVLGEFAKRMENGFTSTLVHEVDFHKGLKAFFREVLEVYCAGEVALGCMEMCTAPSAAVSSPNVQADLLDVIEQLDRRFQVRIELACKHGQITQTTDAKTLSKLFQTVLHSAAIRARAGESKFVLQKFVDGAIVTLLGHN